MDAPVILWFQQDLRLEDHPALSAAVKSGRPVVPLYVLDDDGAGRWAPGGASRWWLHHSLSALGESLEARGNRLLLRRGPAEDVLNRLIAETGAGALYFTRRYEPWAADLQRRLAKSLEPRGVEVRRFGGSLLLEPDALTTKGGGPFKVFTPFYKASLDRLPPRPPARTSERIPTPAERLSGDSLDDWGLLPRAPDWSGGLDAAWTPGEAGAQARLDRFLGDGVADYGRRRDRPGEAGTSRLSPHLHFGEISPRLCWQRTELTVELTGGGESGARAFLRELIWREFCHHLLHHWPDLPERPFRPQFEAFPWAEDAAGLAAWQQGRTGYPIVDAGMRELWHCGWMHNRVRMIAASFLVKHLLIPWQAGEAWFWDTLVDADLANNAAGWQWVAGCGADAAPYFRIFNPMLQGAKFDPEGAYVRTWVPELAALPTRYLHAPWEAPAEALAAAGVRLGESYPEPLVEHAAARRRALAAFERIKGER